MLRECTFKPQLNDKRNIHTKSKIKEIILAKRVREPEQNSPSQIDIPIMNSSHRRISDIENEENID